MRVRIFLALLILPVWLGCTTQSSILARQANYDIQRLKDGIHNDMRDAIAMFIEESEAVDKDIATDYLARLAEWDRDYGMANTKKAVTVDAYLAGQEGILSGLGEKLGICTHVPITTQPALE